LTYILLYRGPATPPDASHEGWPAWFGQIGGALIDIASPMANGHTVHADGTVADIASNLNGYSLIQADDLDAAERLVKDHPFLKHGDEYAIEIFEVPKKQPSDARGDA
jgi:hypothetical protein